MDEEFQIHVKASKKKGLTASLIGSALILSGVLQNLDALVNLYANIKQLGFIPTFLLLFKNANYPTILVLLIGVIIGLTIIYFALREEKEGGVPIYFLDFFLSSPEETNQKYIESSLPNKEDKSFSYLDFVRNINLNRIDAFIIRLLVVFVFLNVFFGWKWDELWIDRILFLYISAYMLFYYEKFALSFPQSWKITIWNILIGFLYLLIYRIFLWVGSNDAYLLQDWSIIAILFFPLGLLTTTVLIYRAQSIILFGGMNPLIELINKKKERAIKYCGLLSIFSLIVAVFNIIHWQGVFISHISISILVALIVFVSFSHHLFKDREEHLKFENGMNKIYSELFSKKSTLTPVSS